MNIKSDGKPVTYIDGSRDARHHVELLKDVTPSSFLKIRLLGRGCVGKVFLVLLKGTQNVYALKEVDKAEMQRKNKVARIFTEREILASIDHPFLVSFYGSFQTSRKLYFVMQYCGGGELFKLLWGQPRHCLSEDAARFYAAEVVLALEYLHMNGVILRDLKPENILLDPNGHIKITDFDLSKTVQPVAPTVIPTEKHWITRAFWRADPRDVHDDIGGFEPTQRTCSVVGTPQYLAPEVIDDESGGGYSASVDWWTLGILIYEMLIGQPPFDGPDPNLVMASIVQADRKISFPAAVKAQLTHDVKDLIRALLHRNPRKRLGSAHGAYDIKHHSWFKSIDWTLIRNERPPILPQTSDPLLNLPPDLVPLEDDDPPPPCDGPGLAVSSAHSHSTSGRQHQEGAGGAGETDPFAAMPRGRDTRLWPIDVDIAVSDDSLSDSVPSSAPSSVFSSSPPFPSIRASQPRP